MVREVRQQRAGAGLKTSAPRFEHDALIYDHPWRLGSGA